MTNDASHCVCVCVCVCSFRHKILCFAVQFTTNNLLEAAGRFFAASFLRSLRSITHAILHACTAIMCDAKICVHVGNILLIIISRDCMPKPFLKSFPLDN